jgi:integrase
MSNVPNNTGGNLTISTPRKRGRKPGAYYTADNIRIEGLTRHKGDNRWRISATGESFFEPDERLAIARFEATMAKLKGKSVVRLPLGPQAGYVEARQAAIDAGARKLYAHVTPEGPEFFIAVGSPQYYAAVREMLINDPVDLSLKTGVEWVARGAGLAKPEPSPTMDELIENYAGTPGSKITPSRGGKPGITDEEKTRCRRFWKEFAVAVGIKTIRELTHDHVAGYEAWIAEHVDSPKSVKHRYTRVRTIIAYGLKRGKNLDDCQRALNVLKMLEAPGGDALDPQPVSTADFWAIHKQVVKAGDKTFAALMLFALNAAMYPSEVGAVKWTELDLKRGEFSSKRNKTDVPRVAVLWPETIKAINSLPRDREHVFCTIRQHYTRMSVFREWNTYRTAAEKTSIKFNQIRDAAFTIACRTDLSQARVLAGHRLPGAVDNYVRRDPGFVSEACKAIGSEFNVALHVK